MPRTRLSMIVSLLIGLLVAACSTGTGTGSGADEADPSAPAPSPSPTLTLASVQPSAGDPLTGDERVKGVLGADSVEGGCGYLKAANGTRYQVRYPDGWELSLSPLELRSPEGDVIARGGDEVTVTGDIDTEMASTCQIGPIFRATSVES
ncbi:hypothetical protein BH23CHL10_BH23CHL10_09770 [soil metagenome]